jgi:hypothetical protein
VPGFRSVNIIDEVSRSAFLASLKKEGAGLMERFLEGLAVVPGLLVALSLLNAEVTRLYGHVVNTSPSECTRGSVKSGVW